MDTTYISTIAFFTMAVGPPFGGVLYQFTGKETPFLILAFLAFADGCMYCLFVALSCMPC